MVCKTYSRDWESLLGGLGKPIRGFVGAYYRVWNPNQRDWRGLFEGLGRLNKWFELAYYRVWDGLLERLERPIKGFGSPIRGFGNAD